MLLRESSAAILLTMKPSQCSVLGGIRVTQRSFLKHPERRPIVQNITSHVQILPTSLELMRNRRTFFQSPLIRNVVNRILQAVCRRTALGDRRNELQFSIVDSPQKWHQIRQLRLATYVKKLPYMLDVINPDGSDEFDARSVIFGIWYQDRAVATLRITAGPLEISRYLPESTRLQALPPGKAEQTLEISRLITDSSAPYTRLMPALIAYAGLSVCLFTDHDHYIGYSKKNVFKKFDKFMCSADLPSFQIPARGEHYYEVVQGSFRQDFNHLIQKRIRPPVLAKMIGAMLLSIA